MGKAGEERLQLAVPVHGDRWLSVRTAAETCALVLVGYQLGPVIRGGL